MPQVPTTEETRRLLATRSGLRSASEIYPPGAFASDESGVYRGDGATAGGVKIDEYGDTISTVDTRGRYGSDTSYNYTSGSYTGFGNVFPDAPAFNRVKLTTKAHTLAPVGIRLTIRRDNRNGVVLYTHDQTWSAVVGTEQTVEWVLSTAISGAIWISYEPTTTGQFALSQSILCNNLPDIQAGTGGLAYKTSLGWFDVAEQYCVKIAWQFELRNSTAINAVVNRQSAHLRRNRFLVEHGFTPVLPRTIYVMKGRRFDVRWYNAFDTGVIPWNSVSYTARCSVNGWCRLLNNGVMIAPTATGTAVLEVSAYFDRNTKVSQIVTIQAIAETGYSGTRSIIYFGDSTGPYSMIQALGICANNTSPTLGGSATGKSINTRGTIGMDPLTANDADGNSRTVSSMSKVGITSAMHRYAGGAVKSDVHERTLALTSLTRSSNECTATKANHPYRVGDSLKIAADGSDFDASAVTVTWKDSNTFKYLDAGNDGTASNPTAQPNEFNLAHFVATVPAWAGVFPATKDLIIFDLGINGPESAATVTANIRAMANRVWLDYPNVRVLITPPKGGSLDDRAWGKFYGASYISAYCRTENEMRIKAIQKSLIQEFDAEVLSGSALVHCGYLQLDRINNYQSSTEAVNVYNSATETIFTDPVHPAPAGYFQYGDALANVVHANDTF